MVERGGFVNVRFPPQTSPPVPHPKNFFPKISHYVPNWQMEQTDSPASLLAGTCLAFAAVPAQRHRADGWTPETQANFIRALEAMGSVGKAARARHWHRRGSPTCDRCSPRPTPP